MNVTECARKIIVEMTKEKKRNAQVPNEIVHIHCKRHLHFDDQFVI